VAERLLLLAKRHARGAAGADEMNGTMKLKRGSFFTSRGSRPRRGASGAPRGRSGGPRWSSSARARLARGTPCSPGATRGRRRGASFCHTTVTVLHRSATVRCGSGARASVGRTASSATTSSMHSRAYRGITCQRSVTGVKKLLNCNRQLSIVFQRTVARKGTVSAKRHFLCCSASLTHTPANTGSAGGSLHARTRAVVECLPSPRSHRRHGEDAAELGAGGHHQGQAEPDRPASL